MTAINDDVEADRRLNDATYAMFDEVSVRFMRAVKSTYGREAAVDTLNHLQTTLGKDWVGRVMFHMMADNFQYLQEFTIHVDPSSPFGVKKINAIKEVRAITGMGLGDSKTFVEDTMEGRPRRAALRTDHGKEATAWQKQVQDHVTGLRNAGFRVDVA